jgi:hypothetical protein
MTGKRRDLPTAKEIASALRQASKGVQPTESKAALDRLSKFADSTLARTAEDGIVALYLAIDTPNVDPALANLVKPLGAFAMTIQIGAGGRRRTPLSSLAPSNTTATFARNCEQAACTLRGAMFEVSGSGVFDVLGGSKSRPMLKGTGANSSVAAKIGIGAVQSKSLARYTSGSEAGLQQRTAQACVDLAAAQCFGNCGPGCPSSPAELFELPQCYAHDFCVCLNDDNHAACLLTVPDGCMTDRGPCVSLAEAVGAFLEAWFGTFVSNLYGVATLLIGFFGDIVGAVFDVVLFSLDVVFDLISDFFDWLFGEDCGEEGEVSPESC